KVVVINAQGEERVLQKGDELFVGEKLEASSGANIHIVYTNGLEQSILSNNQFVFDSALFDSISQIPSSPASTNLLALPENNQAQNDAFQQEQITQQILKETATAALNAAADHFGADGIGNAMFSAAKGETFTDIYGNAITSHGN